MWVLKTTIVHKNMTFVFYSSYDYDATSSSAHGENRFSQQRTTLLYFCATSGLPSRHFCCEERPEIRTHPPSHILATLLQNPLTIFLFDIHGSFLVQADATCVQNGGGQNGVGNGGKPMSVVIFWFGASSVHATSGVDELFDGDVAVPSLAVKVTTLRWRILHAAGSNIDDQCLSLSKR